MQIVRTIATIASLLLISRAAAAGPLDIPTSDDRALSIVELAAASGISLPYSSAATPIDDTDYLSAYRALRARGFIDPVGEQRENVNLLRSKSQFYLESLKPEIKTRYYLLSEGSKRRPLYHSSADSLERGSNFFLAASGAGFWDNRAAVAYELQMGQSSEGFEYNPKRLYLKASWGAWSFKIGRDSERLGPGWHSNLLLDDNAPTMDLWRIRTENPLFLPGALSSIGGFRFMLFNAYLSDSNPTPPDKRYGTGTDAVRDPRLLGMRFSYHPTRSLDFGISRLIMYGGKGREAYDSPKDWWELFSAKSENVHEGESHRYDNDQYAALDFTLRLPGLNGLGPMRGGKIYWEYGATDIISKWQGEETDGWEPFKLNRVASLGGLYLTTGTADLRFEFAQTDSSWYRHGQYSQGFSYKGAPLGHHMGGDARNWYVEIAKFFSPRWRAALGFDLEERSRSSERDDRVEWTLKIDAPRFHGLGADWDLRLDFLTAHLTNPLDDETRRDRNETYLGFSLSSSL